jgi:hypothetical protein
MRKRGTASPQPISGDNVSVKTFEVAVSRTSEEGKSGRRDGYPPLITIVLGVSPSSTDPGISQSIANLQTTISARIPDDNPPAVLVRKDVQGGSARAEEFTMAVVGYLVRPCVTPEEYAAALPGKTEEEKEKIAEDIRKELAREPDPVSGDPLGGVCRAMIKREGDNAPDICLFPGSREGSLFTMRRGEYCVDERRTFYSKSFEGDCKDQERLPNPLIDSIEVNEYKVCDVINTIQR